jgi:hypothetical protein
MKEEINEEPESEKKGIRGNAFFLIIMSCWLLFFVYVGLHGGR